MSGPPVVQQNVGDQQVADILNQAVKGFKGTVDPSGLVGPIRAALDRGVAPATIVQMVQQSIGYNPAAETTQDFQKPNATGSGLPGTAPTTPAAGGEGTGGAAQIDPSIVASQILQSVLSNAPKPSDPKYASQADPQTAYMNDYLVWQQMLGQAVTVSKSIQDMQAGYVDLGGGKIITQAQFDKLSPQDQAMVAAQYAQNNAKTTNDYNQMLNQLGLSQYQAQSTANANNNAALSQNFQNQLSAFNTQITLGQANQDTAVKGIARQLQGMQESRARADTVTSAMQAAAPLASPSGQTSFSANDLGSAAAGLARLGGANPSLPLLNFTGTRTVNPAGLMAASDQALGVGGALPTIPGLGVSGTIPQPQAPSLMGAPPAAAPYVRPPLLPIPQMAGSSAPSVPYLVPPTTTGQ